jgi:hypothetical protein
MLTIAAVVDASFSVCRTARQKSFLTARSISTGAIKILSLLKKTKNCWPGGWQIEKQNNLKPTENMKINRIINHARWTWAHMPTWAKICDGIIVAAIVAAVIARRLK